MLSSNQHALIAPIPNEFDLAHLDSLKPCLDGMTISPLPEFRQIDKIQFYANQHVGSIFYKEANSHIAPLSKLQQFLTSCFRFVIKTNLGITLAADGEPDDQTPSHAQMTEGNLYAISAGAVFPNEAKQIHMIDSQSGSFHAHFDSLQIFLIHLWEEMQKQQVEFAETVILRDAGKQGKKYDISRQDLIRQIELLKSNYEKTILTPEKIAEYTAMTADINYKEVSYYANTNKRIKLSLITEAYSSPTKQCPPTPRRCSYVKSMENDHPDHLTVLNTYSAPLNSFQTIATAQAKCHRILDQIAANKSSHNKFSFFNSSNFSLYPTPVSSSIVPLTQDDNNHPYRKVGSDFQKVTP